MRANGPSAVAEHVKDPHRIHRMLTPMKKHLAPVEYGCHGVAIVKEPKPTLQIVADVQKIILQIAGPQLLVVGKTQRLKHILVELERKSGQILREFAGLVRSSGGWIGCDMEIHSRQLQPGCIDGSQLFKRLACDLAGGLSVVRGMAPGGKLPRQRCEWACIDGVVHV